MRSLLSLQQSILIECGGSETKMLFKNLTPDPGEAAQLINKSFSEHMQAYG